MNKFRLLSFGKISFDREILKAQNLFNEIQQTIICSSIRLVASRHAKIRLNLMRRISAYIVGGLFTTLGIMGFIVEFSEGKASSTIVAGYMMAIVFVIWGPLLCLAVCWHYGGGAWSFIGAILVGYAMIHGGFSLDVYLRGRHFISPIIDFSIIATFWGVGCYCLVWGHMRHHRKKIPPN